MNNIKIFFKAVLFVAVACTLIIVGLSLLTMVPTWIRRAKRPKIHEVTSPLEETVVQDLCQKLDLSERDPICQPGAVVYGPDFFPAVMAAFKPGTTTYDDIQEKLGPYQYKREPTITLQDGTTYFMSGYDFQGDRVFPVGFSFTGDGILEQIFATVGDD